MSALLATVQFITELPFQELVIPDYQRPYVWQLKELRQLWDDILQSLAHDRKDYRIGTIILHENADSGKLEIVDGQQRLTTLSLLLYMLNHEETANLCCSSFLSEKQFLHQSSAQNILNNCNELRQWIEEELIEPSELYAYILNHCSVTVLKVNHISAAFQIFDTQNGRGLTLQAYNLLKAYHMRFLDHLPEDEKIKIDKNWESSARNEKHKDYLEQVIHEQLYRTRVWANNQEAYAFTKKHIKEFKGSSVTKLLYPYENYVYQSSILNEDMVRRFPTEKYGIGFEITQRIKNGDHFFEYIQAYVSIYQYLFESTSDNEDIKDFLIFYNKYCTRFSKKGDEYLLELYKSLIMCLFDRFGILGLNKYYKLLYACVFRFRLEKKFVKYASVAKLPTSLFTGICNAKDILDLRFIREYALQPIEKKDNGNNEIVEQFFDKHIKVEMYS
ncbi:DUF262 domain-containing protein [Flavobacterium sp.]|uniref:DUF262 domain-containing protein n=1 Tax=Flavobacterium sp. TaxID=239 RepID=UPI0035B22B93